MNQISQIARFMGPTWGPPGSCRPHVGPHVGPMNLAIRNCLHIHPLLPVHPRGLFYQAGLVKTSIEIRVCISSYIHVKQWDVITHPRPNLNGGLFKPPLKLWYGWESLIAIFMGPAWCPSGAGRTQMGPMLAPWTLLSGYYIPNKTMCVITYVHILIAFKPC